MRQLNQRYGEQCTHKGLKHVLTIDKCRLWAGSAKEALAEYKRMKFAVSLLDWDGFRGWQVPLGEFPGRHAIPWPNGGALKEGPTFWRRLYGHFALYEGDAVLFCFGGHGRTGTALATLVWINGVCGDTDPVVWLRQHYCREAVETAEQIAYLREMGVKTDAAPSMLTPAKR